MANTGIERMMMLFSITERGSGRELIEYLDQRKIKLHCQCAGTGTAPSEMMDILGLGTRSKDIVISFATRSAMQNLANELSNNIYAVSRGKGIMMMLSPNAVSQVFAAMITRQTGEITVTGGEDNVKSEYKHSLIFISVNHGYSDQVMQTAKKAGATGGTVIRARLAGAEQAEQFYGVMLQEEKEIITILAADTVRDQILEDVNKNFGLRTEAQAIVCAIPVDRAFKI